MEPLRPSARLFTAVLWIAVAFSVTTVAGLAGAYAAVLCYLANARTLRAHGRFLALAGIPLLGALLLLWGLIVPATQPSVPAGVAIASAAWLRIVICAASIQWLLYPLARAPVRLKAFLHRLHLPHAASILLISPILLLPEVERRLRQIADARKAQGLDKRGLAGVFALPAMMVPLLTSLIDISLVRAELWDHRGALTRVGDIEDIPWWSIVASFGPLLLPAALIAAGALRWL